MILRYPDDVLLPYLPLSIRARLTIINVCNSTQHSRRITSVFVSYQDDKRLLLWLSVVPADVPTDMSV